MRASMRVLRNSSAAISPSLYFIARDVPTQFHQAVEATIRAGALPSARRAGDGRNDSRWRFCCLAARRHRMDDSIVLEEHREARVVPAGDGRLPYGRMLLGGRTKMLLHFGHRAAALRPVHGRVTQGELIVYDQSLGQASAAGCEAAKQCDQNSSLHG